MTLSLAGECFLTMGTGILAFLLIYHTCIFAGMLTGRSVTMFPKVFQVYCRVRYKLSGKTHLAATEAVSIRGLDRLPGTKWIIILSMLAIVMLCGLIEFIYWQDLSDGSSVNTRLG